MQVQTSLHSNTELDQHSACEKSYWIGVMLPSGVDPQYRKAAYSQSEDPVSSESNE
jgi:hypothetical protein